MIDAATRARIWSKIDATDNRKCYIWTASRNADGYGQTSIGGKRISAHRAMWWLAHGEPPPEDRVVMHTCDNPACCNPQHLRLGTQTENIADRVSKGRNADLRGEAHGKARLTEDDVRVIRTSDAPHAALAREYGVTRQNIWRIRNNRSWRHVRG